MAQCLDKKCAVLVHGDVATLSRQWAFAGSMDLVLVGQPWQVLNDPYVVVDLNEKNIDIENQNSSVCFESLLFQNGKASSGGAISSSPTGFGTLDLRLHRCMFKNNKAEKVRH